MSFEYKNTIPIVKEKTEVSLDDMWYDRFEKSGAFQDYEYLEGEKKNREQQKKYFLDEKTRNPKLDYPKLESFDFDEKEKSLIELKEDILEKESDEVVRQAYRWKINEKIAELRMLRASKEGNDKKFKKYSKFIYGNPEKEIFLFDLEIIRKNIEESEKSDDARILFAAKRLKDSLSVENLEDSGIKNDFLPNKKRIIQYPFQEERIFDAENIKDKFIEALQEFKIEGWEVVINKNINAISVSQEKKQVNIPQTRKLTESKLKELIAHEIGTHVLRRENGERSKLKLLGLGLDRYLKGEEGISTYAEQQLGGADDFSGLDGHLAVSLAQGVDGKKRDFRDVFNILRDYFFIRSKEKDLVKAWDKAKNDAWNRCVRTFRGTTCDSKGACLSRDMVYREGNINTWIVVKGNPDADTNFSIGKIDPANFRHAWIIEKLCISENDLETLDS